MEAGRGTIRAARVTLRPLDPGTATAIVMGDRPSRGWASDFPADGDVMVARMTAQAPPVDVTNPVAEPWLVRWLVECQGEVVGGVGCKGAPRDGAVEIGYGIVSSVQGRGVATEAVGALIGALADAGVTTVRAETLVDNHASRRVLEKLGFVETGRRHDDVGVLIA